MCDIVNLIIPRHMVLLRCQKKLKPGTWWWSRVISICRISWISNMRTQELLSDFSLRDAWIINQSFLFEMTVSFYFDWYFTIPENNMLLASAIYEHYKDILFGVVKKTFWGDNVTLILSFQFALQMNVFLILRMLIAQKT